MTCAMMAGWAVSAGMAGAAQPVDGAAILRKIDAAVKARQDGIEAYTVTEHYAVFRNKDETHPAAEMTVKTTYRRETGKSYAILSESGSALLRNLVLHAILTNEKQVNEPGVREGSWITRANYEMAVKPGGIQSVDGRDCVAVTLKPRRRTLSSDWYVVGGCSKRGDCSGGVNRLEELDSVCGDDADDAPVCRYRRIWRSETRPGRVEQLSVRANRGNGRLPGISPSTAARMRAAAVDRAAN